MTIVLTVMAVLCLTLIAAIASSDEKYLKETRICLCVGLACIVGLGVLAS